jgi:hypothetical protein
MNKQIFFLGAVIVCLLAVIIVPRLSASRNSDTNQPKVTLNNYENTQWKFGIDHRQSEPITEWQINDFDPSWFSIGFSNDDSTFLVYAEFTTAEDTESYVHSSGHRVLFWVHKGNGDQIAVIERNELENLGMGQAEEDRLPVKAVSAVLVKNGIAYKILEEEYYHLDQPIVVTSELMRAISAFYTLD